MKTAFLLFGILVLFATLKAQAALPPTTLKAQNGSKATTFNFEVPNQQSTKTTTGGLIETGNSNILKDPSLEGANNSGAWVFNFGTLTIDNTPVHGLINGLITAAANSVEMVQSSTINAAQYADGVQGLAYMRVRTSVTSTPIYVCPLQAGSFPSQLSSGCALVQANGKWGLYKVPFILGATSNGIGLTTNAVSITGDIEWDDAFVGAVDLKQDVDQSRIAGESYFAGTTSCTWSRTSTTIGAFTSTAACPGPTVVDGSMGSWQATDSDLPRQTITNLPAGKYKATFIVANNGNGTNRGMITINDGTTTCEPVISQTSGLTSGAVISCSFTYASSGNRVFELHGASTGGALTISNDATAPRASIKFQLEYFGSGSVYSSTNADTDWASCTPNSYNGLGTPTAVEIQCKRSGGDLLFKGKFASGVTTPAEMRIGLPSWNGTVLTSKGISAIPSIQVAGTGNVNVNAATTFGGFSVLIEPSVTYLTIGAETSTSNGLTKVNGNGIASSGTLISFNARIPINGWENSSVIIGSFSGIESCTDSYECTDTFSAKVSSAGVVSDENIDWISGNFTIASTSSYTGTWRSNLSTVAMNCVTTTKSGTGVVLNNGITATGGNFIGQDTATGANKAQGFEIICQKQGADYIGKTAKAVASDQNDRTPGVTNAVTYRAKISSAGVVSSESSDWINGSCTVGTGTATCPLNVTLNNIMCTCDVLATASGTGFDCLQSSATTTTSLQYYTTANWSLSSRDVQVECTGNL